MKNLLLVFVFACLTFPSFGQFSLGLSASVNRTFWKWDAPPSRINVDYQPEYGNRGVLMGEYKFSNLLRARAEVGAQGKANHFSLKFDDGSEGYYRENFLFWEGSLLAQISPLKKLQPLYLILGGTYGRLTKGWKTLEGVGDGLPDGPHFSAIELDPEVYNLNAFAADLGIGWNIPLGAGNQIKIEGRFQYGLTNLAANEEVDAKADPLMLSVGYLHRL